MVFVYFVKTRISNVLVYYSKQDEFVSKARKAISSIKVKVKATSSLSLVSFERASLVEYACKIWIYLLSSKVIAKVKLKTDRTKIDVCKTLMPLSPTYLNRFHCLTFDLLNWLSIGCIYFSSTIYLPSLKLLWQSVLELSVARCMGDRPTYRPTDMCKAICPSFFKGVPGFPQSLKSPWILGFPWKVLENEFVLEKSLNLGDLPWNFNW